MSYKYDIIILKTGDGNDTPLAPFLRQYPQPCMSWRERMDMTIGQLTAEQQAEGAYHYAKDVIKGPWKPGERAINAHIGWAKLYEECVIKGHENDNVV